MSDPADRVTLTEKQQKAQKGRSIAIALSLIAFVVIIYAVTVVKLGPDVLNRAL